MKQSAEGVAAHPAPPALWPAEDSADASADVIEPSPLGAVRRRPDFPLESVVAALRLHDEALAGRPPGRVVKQGEKVRVTILPSADAACESLFVKEFVRHPFLRFAPSFIRHQPAIRSWRVARLLAVRRIPAADVRALVLGPGRSSWLIMREFRDGLTADRYIKRALPAMTPRRRRAFVRATAGFLRRLYAAGVVHEDLKCGNLLVRETGEESWEFALLDLAAARFSGRAGTAWKLLNLAQLNASAPLTLTWTDRRRILDALAHDDPALGGRSVMAVIARITRQRGRVWDR